MLKVKTEYRGVTKCTTGQNRIDPVNLNKVVSLDIDKDVLPTFQAGQKVFKGLRYVHTRFHPTKRSRDEGDPFKEIPNYVSS